MPPSMLAKHWGCLLESSDAYILAPKTATHRPRNGTHNVLDFAVCSASAEPWIDSVRVDEGFHVSPHRAVRISMRAGPCNYLVDSFKRPRAFAKRPPIGCSRRPILPSWARPSSGEGDQVSSVGSHAARYPQTVDGMWPDLCHAMETELCRLHGHVNIEGMAAAAYTGRSAGVRVVQKIALPMKASAALRKVSMPAHALAWLSTRVRELACFSCKIERGHQISENARVQWTSIMDRVLAGTGLPEIIRRIAPAWEEKLDFIRSHRPGLRYIPPRKDIRVTIS